MAAEALKAARAAAAHYKAIASGGKAAQQAFLSASERDAQEAGSVEGFAGGGGGGGGSYAAPAPAPTPVVAAVDRDEWRRPTYGSSLQQPQGASTPWSQDNSGAREPGILDPVYGRPPPQQQQAPQRAPMRYGRRGSDLGIDGSGIGGVGGGRGTTPLQMHSGDQLQEARAQAELRAQVAAEFGRQNDHLQGGGQQPPARHGRRASFTGSDYGALPQASSYGSAAAGGISMVGAAAAAATAAAAAATTAAAAYENPYMASKGVGRSGAGASGGGGVVPPMMSGGHTGGGARSQLPMPNHHQPQHQQTHSDSAAQLHRQRQMSSSIFG